MGVIFIVTISLFLIESFVSASATHRCGELNISCPFRLKDSPARCANASLEVVCNGTDAFLYTGNGGHKYLITNISYSSNTIRLVDPSFVSGHCPLPALPRQWHHCYDQITINSNLQVVPSDPCENYGFLNCSQPLNDSHYIPVPCPSSSGSNMYLFQEGQYILEDFLGDLPNSCGNIASTILSENLTTNSSILVILPKGFLAHWSFIEPHSDGPTSVKQCWKLVRHNLRWKGLSLGNWLLNVLEAGMSMASCIEDFQFARMNMPFGDSKFQDSYTFYNLEAVLTLLLIYIPVLLLVGRVIIAPLVFYIFLIYKYWNSFITSIDAIEKFLRQHAISSVRRYDFSDIVIITSHFKEKLGQGGFGAVYKGKLFNGSLVAVKMLNDSKFGGEDFISEVATIGKIHHANIVQLVGFCSERSKRAVIYEYMSNGSLDKYIFSRSNDATISTAKRREIAIGIARGIDYLHRGCEMQILHFDIKPHNILLDNNLTPKISDFGLAKLYPREYNTVMVSAARGTIGYTAPELVSRNFGTISQKADVYSFGMLLLELAGGRKNVDPEAGNQNQVYYPSWIYDQLTQREKNEASSVTIEIGEIEGILAKVGLWCIQSNPSNRPSMSRVIEMLQMDKYNMEMPPKPFADIAPEEMPNMDSLPESSSIELSVIHTD